ITSAAVQGVVERPAWGHLCGRDPEEARVRPNRHFELFRRRERVLRQVGQELLAPPGAPVIGMPRALLAHSYVPLWRAFCAALGYQLELGPATSRQVVELASDWVGADYCFPVKLAHGHARMLLEQQGLPRVLVPYMVRAGEAGQQVSQTYFCPYNIGLPAMIESAMVLRGIDPRDRLLKPTLDLRWDDRTAAERLHRDLGQALGRSRGEIAAAWRRAITVQRRVEAELAAMGRTAMAEVLASEQPAVVILGRPYNVYDAGANLALPEKIARLGLTVVPLELLPLDEQRLGHGFDNMFWNYGRKILEAARFVASTPNVYAVCLSNFACGPDSFIQTYAEQIMGGKPMLMLELDEHGADAGYMTRLEAFADVVAAHDRSTPPRYDLPLVPATREALAGRKLWVPPMHEATTRLAAAAMCASGLQARPLPGEDMAAFLAGRRATRGGECVPCPATLGAFLTAVRREGGDPAHHALFMPTAEGPCRFGQYCTLDRIALDRQGWPGVPIVSWNSRDSYDGVDRRARRRIWTAIVLGDVLFKMRCRVLPYERLPGTTEQLFERWIERLGQALAEGEKLEPLLRRARDEFMA
ncbi:MAG: hypothetical protein FJ125_16020, partial [Deltaproteobacteria bacterium]|nr:hypothetical protein [Deltaproteobacteria bacterium]